MPKISYGQTRAFTAGSLKLIETANAIIAEEAMSVV